jgi:hypothetical protein
MVAHTCYPSYGGKPKIGRLWSRAAWAKKQNLIFKVARVKRAGSVDQAVEHLPSKYEALSSNPNTANKNKQKIQIDFSLV